MVNIFKGTEKPGRFCRRFCTNVYGSKNYESHQKIACVCDNGECGYKVRHKGGIIPLEDHNVSSGHYCSDEYGKYFDVMSIFWSGFRLHTHEIRQDNSWVYINMGKILTVKQLNITNTVHSIQCWNFTWKPWKQVPTKDKREEYQTFL